jgi:para-nitrobenzyl esterase
MPKITKNLLSCIYLTPLLTSLMLSGCGSDDNILASELEVMTEQGIVKGVAGEDSAVSFKGIPYATAERFKAPTIAVMRDYTFLADDFGSDCPQIGGAFGASSVDEDCLFVNVYTPNTLGDLPVMVWIHGGAFVSGSGGSSYEPQRLQNQGVVVVTLNYRLGALGFLAHADLSTEMGGGSGNFGLMDQQLALQWVQDNISNFGGNAQNVTIFGESAGGHSVLSQMASPSSANLFHKAIIQSGSYNPDQRTLAAAETIGADLVQTLGCDGEVATLECLRALPVTEILKGQATSYIPNTQTDILPLSIRAAINAGSFNQVPVISGTNLHEGRLFTALQELAVGPLSGEENYRLSVNSLLSTAPFLDTDTIASDYLALQDSESAQKYSLALSAIQTDGAFACEALTQTLSLDQYVDIYSYHFTDENAPSLFPPVLSFPLGATHAFEIQYLLNSEETMLKRGAGAAQIDLSNAMLEYWSNFAKIGNPSSESSSLTQWLALSTGNMLELNEVITSKAVGEFDTTHSCSSYWAQPPLSF